MDKHCEFISEAGKRCNAYRITGSRKCFQHSDNPEIVVMRDEALKKAKESRRLYFPVAKETNTDILTVPFVRLDTPKGIKKAYITIIKAAAQGMMDERRLGALTYALNGYVNALEKMESFMKDATGPQHIVITYEKPNEK